jgi:hypothetical protein
MNTEMQMHKALEGMPDAITSRASKVNYLIEECGVTWAVADAFLRDWEARQEPQGYISDDPMIDAEVKNDLGAEVPFNGGEGFAFKPWDGEKAKEFFAALDAAMDDAINPAHYQSESGVEAIDAIHAALGDEQFKGYLRGNAMKYLFRCERKGSPLENAKKAEWYIKRLIAEYELEEETRSDVNG